MPASWAATHRLAQSDEALLRLCRLCCSVRMHCQGMTVDEATRFFRERCHYEGKPARSEATRGTHDPGYLFYTLGKMEILALRDAARRQAGERFDLRGFHSATPGRSWSSATGYLEPMGWRDGERAWQEFPMRDDGRRWDAAQPEAWSPALRRSGVGRRDGRGDEVFGTKERWASMRSFGSATG